MSIDLRDKLRRFAPFVLGAFLLVGVVFFMPRLDSAEVTLSFRLPPVLRAQPSSIRRQEIASLEALIEEPDGKLVASITLDFPEPLSRPVTNSAHLRAPAGEYLAFITVRARDGRTAVRTVPLLIRESGPLWVELD